MESIKQIQKAGPDSSVAQIGTIQIYGIDEKRVREICDEKLQYAIRDLTTEASNVAKQKVNEFITVLLGKLSGRKPDLSAFAEPSFQRELVKAQTFSATSDRKSDFEILSELLLARMNRQLKRKTKTGISRAMEVVTELDDDELLGITIVFLVLALSITPQFGSDIQAGLDKFEQIFAQFPLDELPSTTSWFENLNMLDAVIINPFGGFSKFTDVFENKLNGYVCVGIRRDSPEFEKANELLQKASLSELLLTSNEFLQGYYRLPIVAKADIKSLSLQKEIFDPKSGQTIQVITPITDHMLQTLSEIFALYSKDKKLLSEVKRNFEAKLSKYPSLCRVQKWFDAIPTSFRITKVGRALAYVNGKRYVPDLPELSLESD